MLKGVYIYIYIHTHTHTIIQRQQKKIIYNENN
jgi:hypothetical protein